jgi:hypothetical protein
VDLLGYIGGTVNKTLGLFLMCQKQAILLLIIIYIV